MTADFASLKSHILHPTKQQKVYKDECIFSFDSPESPDGLFVCMATFHGLGKAHVQSYFNRHGHPVYINIIRRKWQLPDVEEVKDSKPKRLAIGVEGGFALDEKKFKYEETYQIVTLPKWTTQPFPDPSLPDFVVAAVTAVLAADSASKLEDLAAMAGTWDGEVLQNSKFANNLQQLPVTKKIPPCNWKCERCDMQENLWLNLTDGTILCGRRFWDGTGGNNHAVEHYATTNYPLAVKLGTVTPDGADVYSYAEDDMVKDPLLQKHLQHWGIDIMKMKKTEKTMTELEIDLNQKVGEWDVIQEAGFQLQPLYGPGYTGMINLGNSCYMNSVLQVLFSIPDFQKKYYQRYENIIVDCTNEPTYDIVVQLAKIGDGLLSGKYSQQNTVPQDIKEPVLVKPNGIKPSMFKALIGKGHVEFSTKRQQDAQEFLLHMFNTVERNSRGSENPCDCMKFKAEERLECMRSQKVKYKYRTDCLLTLPIPMEACINKEEVAEYESRKREAEASKVFLDPSEQVRPKVPLNACLESYIQPEYIEGFYSSALQDTSTAIKTSRLVTFPDFLFIQLKKFTLGDDWIPKKLDVSVDMPFDLDLSGLKGTGKQSWEEELPEDKPKSDTKPVPEVRIDEVTVNQLMDMGFPLDACKRAVYNTKNCGAEAAAGWLMEHISDPDFTAPFELPGSSSGNEASGTSLLVNDEAVAAITSMGFTTEQAMLALKSTNNDPERAADWLFSHAGDLDAAMASLAEPQEGTSHQDVLNQIHFTDGSSKYRLVAFVSHMGTSSMVGHYVCHIKKDGKWVIFNDEKVALSEKLPKDLGYLYLYQRI